MPYLSIVTLLECVQLAVICAPVRIDLRLLVPQQDASHGPLTIDEATVAHLQVLVIVAARTPDLQHFFGD